MTSKEDALSDPGEEFPIQLLPRVVDGILRPR